MLPDRVSNPGPLTYESGALPIALRGPALSFALLTFYSNIFHFHTKSNMIYFCLSRKLRPFLYSCFRWKWN